MPKKRTQPTGLTARQPARPYARVYEGDKPTHVLVPIEDYEQMLLAEAVPQAIRTAADPDTQWVDADDWALRLAGRRIAECRKAKGVTQNDLAQRLKIDQSQISRIERNPDRSTLKTLKRIAKALGVDVRHLID